jgi:hypothetical protein
MKKVLFFLASVMLLASCENYYIDKNLGGSEYNPTDVRTIDYTLTAADYKGIVDNKENQSISINEDQEAFTRIATDLAFNDQAPASMYLPAYLAAKFPQLSKGSLFNITYNTTKGRPEYLASFANTKKQTLTPADYETIWQGKTGINYLTPATVSQLTSLLPEDGQEGDIVAVVYDYKSQEPIFASDEEETPATGDPNFFSGTPESRGYLTPTEVIDGYNNGTIVDGDTIKVGGIISKWYKKSSRFDEFLNVSYYIHDNNGAEFEMYNSYSVNRDSFPVYDFVSEYEAYCEDAAGRLFSLGDTVIGIGAFTYYAAYNVYEFKSGCYLLEHRPVNTKQHIAPKKSAANTDGKKTVLYHYNGGKWSVYTNSNAIVVALPEDVYTAVGYTYLLDKNKDVLTTFLAQEYPYAQAEKAYTVVYVSTKEGTYNAIEFIYNGTEFVENLGMSTETSTFSLKDIWGSSIYYKQAIIGEGQGKLTIQNVICNEPLSYVWYYSASYGMCASAFKDNESHESESWLITPLIDLTRADFPEFSFDHAFNKAEGDFTNECAVMISTDYAGDVTTATWTQLAWNTLEDGTLDVPAGNSWTFQPTGKLNMSDYVGQKIYIAFRYTTEGGKSGTWEIKNLLLCEPE